jgi:hypothetical protein
VAAYKKKKPSQEPSTPKKLLKIAGHFLASAVSFVQSIFLCVHFSLAFAIFVFLIFLGDMEKKSF